MGSIHSLYIPTGNSRTVSATNTASWQCQNAFQKMKLGVANIVELKPFDIQKDIRIICDASQNGLGVVIEQLGTEMGRPISFASQYLNAAEKNTSLMSWNCWQLSEGPNISETICMKTIYCIRRS